MIPDAPARRLLGHRFALISQRIDSTLRAATLARAVVSSPVTRARIRDVEAEIEILRGEVDALLVLVDRTLDERGAGA